MCNFIRVDIGNDVEYVNLDCVVMISNSGSHAKLYFSKSEYLETNCSYPEFLDMVKRHLSDEK